LRSSVVIVGSGQGGFQAAASLREEGYQGRVTLVGEEPGVPYQRPPLSKDFLAGRIGEQQLELRPAAFYADWDIELLHGERVVGIDRQAQAIWLGSGGTRRYEHLVLATGATPRMPRLPGVDLPGVFKLRTFADARALRERLQETRRIVIIGAGFIGMEVAVVARELGLEVDVLEFSQKAMERSVSAETAEFLAAALAHAGARIHFSTRAEAFVGSEAGLRAVATHRGDTLAADLVVMGVGVEANDVLAREAGLQVNSGVVVDDLLVTSDRAISAIGDCARFPISGLNDLVRLESVQNAVDQARCVAGRLVGKSSGYQKVPWFWSNQGSNRLQIAGLAHGSDTSVIRGSLEDGRFSVLRFRCGRLTAVESINSAADHMAARKLLAAGVNVNMDQAADTNVRLASLLTAF
jgi:3-phenylpropionate/trans-cinnamate dioxygenase ferredoxin reductase subunit